MEIPKSEKARPTISISNSLGTREQTAVDCVHNRRGANHASTEITTVEALDCVFASLDLVEFEVYVALRVRFEGNMDHMAIFLFGFLSNVILQFFNPGFTFFPIKRYQSALIKMKEYGGGHVLRGVKHVV